MSTTVDIPDAVVQSFKKFKLSREVNRMFISSPFITYWLHVVKVNKEDLIVEEEAIIENVEDMEEFAEEELPEGEPRFLAYS